MRKLLIAILMMACTCTVCMSQTTNPVYKRTIVRSGNNFVQLSQRKDSVAEQKTQYVYTDIKGDKHPVYLSARGFAFVYMVSKKTGRRYKQYLPEIGRQINPDAYKKRADYKSAK